MNGILRINMIRLLSTMIVILLMILCAGLPTIESSSLMNGTQSAKTFLFLAAISLLLLLVLTLILLKKNFKRIYFHRIDYFLIVFILYVLVRNNLEEIKNSLLFLELIGLSLFYFMIRITSSKWYVWIFTGLMIGGLIQGMYGNLQLWGFFSSNHSLYKMTGSFFNPGPYAGYLAAVFPIAMGFYLFKVKGKRPVLNHIPDVRAKTGFGISLRLKYNADETRSGKNAELFKYLPILTIFFIILVLPASRSRAAWLALLISSSYLISIKYQLTNKLLSRFHNKIQRTLLVLSFTLIFLIISGVLYHFNTGSVEGRWLIWKVSSKMLLDKPVNGQGYDAFKSHYMNYQAKYFKTHIENSETMVAGDSNYAFNEPIQLIVEYGVIGLLLILVIIYSMFFIKIISGLHGEKYKSGMIMQSEPDTGIPIIHIAKAIFLSVLVFSLFSYSSQILAIKLCFTSCLAIVAGTYPPGLKQKEVSFNPVLKIVMCIILAFLISWLTLQMFQLKSVYKYWKSGYDLYAFKMYEDCLADYEKIYPFLYYNGAFLTNYGKALSMAQKHEDAVGLLIKASKYYPNTIVYTSLGDSYKKLGKISEAEECYLHAWYMNPSRFYPKYLLAKLYNESGQKDKACAIAKELIKKDVKIESMAVEEIKKEMVRILSLK